MKNISNFILLDRKKKHFVFLFIICLSIFLKKKRSVVLIRLKIHKLYNNSLNISLTSFVRCNIFKYSLAVKSKSCFYDGIPLFFFSTCLFDLSLRFVFVCLLVFCCCCFVFGNSCIYINLFTHSFMIL